MVGTGKAIIERSDFFLFLSSTADCVLGEWSEWKNYHKRTRTVSRPDNSSYSCGGIDTERRYGASRKKARFLMIFLHELGNSEVAEPTEASTAATASIMVIGGESVPWWRTDHAYIDDVEMLDLGDSTVGDNGCSATTKFPDSISAAAGAVMGEYGGGHRLREYLHYYP